MMTGDDLNLVERVLKDWRNYARAHRYGGLNAKYQEALLALETLGQIRAWIEHPQLALQLQGDEDAEPLSVQMY